MGFTIDIASGEMLEKTGTQISEKSKLNEHVTEISGFTITEPMVSVREWEGDPTFNNSIPDSVSQADVDSFLDKFT